MYTKYAKLRDDHNMNDLKVAEAIGIAPSTIYDWKQRSAENPKAGISTDKLVKIAKLFDVSVEELIDE